MFVQRLLTPDELFISGEDPLPRAYKDGEATRKKRIDEEGSPERLGREGVVADLKSWNRIDRFTAKLQRPFHMWSKWKHCYPFFPSNSRACRDKKVSLWSSFTFACTANLHQLRMLLILSLSLCGICVCSRLRTLSLFASPRELDIEKERAQAPRTRRTDPRFSGNTTWKHFARPCR